MRYNFRAEFILAACRRSGILRSGQQLSPPREIDATFR
jgi:hypothetical protein